MKKLMLVFILIILVIGGCKKEGIPDNNIENTNAEKILKGEREIAEGRGIPHSEVEKLSKNYPLRPNGP